MIHLYEQRTDGFPILIFRYSNDVTMDDAKKLFTDKYRKKLSDSNSGAIHIESLEKYLKKLNNGLSLKNLDDIDKMIANLLFIKHIHYTGAGYYRDGDCVLLDNRSTNVIFDSDVTTYLLKIDD